MGVQMSAVPRQRCAVCARGTDCRWTDERGRWLCAPCGHETGGVRSVVPIPARPPATRERARVWNCGLDAIPTNERGLRALWTKVRVR
jgi:hypothetical protein